MTKQLKQEDDRDQPGLAEKITIGISIVAVLVIFATTALEAIRAPEGPDLTAEVMDTEPRVDGLYVDVVLVNHGGAGVRSATIEVPCDDPAPTMAFQNVPAAGRRQGTIVCPPDAAGPTVSVVSWSMR